MKQYLYQMLKAADYPYNVSRLFAAYRWSLPPPHEYDAKDEDKDKGGAKSGGFKGEGEEGKRRRRKRWSASYTGSPRCLAWWCASCA